MKRFSCHICIFLALTTLSAVAAATDARPAVPPEERLASQLARSVSLVLRQEPLSVEAMDIAAILAEEAANLMPDDPDLWRLVHAAASLAEREELSIRALERVVALDPADEVARLKKVSHELRQHQTVEDLAAALERLLSQESRDRLGPAVSSRLAMDLALLERRRGNDERFAERLAQAAALDPSNQHAASLAAGYFQMHVNDPAAEGELLLHLLLSNPISVENAVLFAAHLVGHGAYEGAERFYEIAVRAYEALHVHAPADLVADAAIAQFGRGDAAGALRRLADRQRQADIILHQQLQRQRPDLSPRDRAGYFSPLSTAFATVRAAIYHRTGEDAARQAGFANVAYEQAIRETQESERLTEQERNHRTAQLRLEQAWVLMWLGGEMEVADETLDKARALGDLSETAEQRFEGWKALRSGERERAISMLEVIAPDDPPSRLGLALALVEDGRRRDGARELLAIARSQPGTLIGVYAADVLAELLGRRVPLTPEAAELEALAAKFPRVLDRMMTEPSAALSVRLLPAASNFAPHGPMIVNIEITNNTTVPLAIDPSGPIQPEIAIIPAVQIVRARVGAMPPIIVGIDRRLRLMPRERMIVQVDLRRTHLGAVLDRFAILGGIVRLRGVSNFRATYDGSIIPALLGSETRPPSVWVDGVRLTQEWLDESIRMFSDASPAEQELTRLALFGVAISGEPAMEMRAEERRLLDEARQVAADAFARADGASQAWLISVWPPQFLDRAADRERYGDDRLVHLAHLLYRVREANDPLVAEALRGDDLTLRRLAELIRKGMTDEEEGGLLGGTEDRVGELPAEK